MPPDQATGSGGEDPARPAHDSVRTLTERALGSPVTRITADRVGGSNAVYFVTLADSGQYVVRVSPVGRGPLVEQELWALNGARAHGVPVPEVIFAETAQRAYPAPYSNNWGAIFGRSIASRSRASAT
jgi:aminoglycoside phosphotransferase (APT) family kinase protein